MRRINNLFCCTQCKIEVPKKDWWFCTVLTLLCKIITSWSRHAGVFQKLPIRCTRRRGFKNQESRKSVWLWKDSENSAGRGRCFHYGKQRHLLANYTFRLLPLSFCQLLLFKISLSTFLTLPRLKALLVHSFCLKWKSII